MRARVPDVLLPHPSLVGRIDVKTSECMTLDKEDSIHTSECVTMELKEASLPCLIIKMKWKRRSQLRVLHTVVIWRKRLWRL